MSAKYTFYFLYLRKICQLIMLHIGFPVLSQANGKSSPMLPPVFGEHIIILFPVGFFQIVIIHSVVNRIQ